MHRGLKLPARKESSTRSGLGDASVPARVFLALPSGGEIELCAATGDNVLTGQLLARSGARRIHAPVSGKVIAVKQTPECLLIEIDNDSRDQLHPSVQPIADYKSLAPEALRARIESAGIIGLGGASFPTAIKLTIAAESRTQTLIINGVECEPFISCDDALLQVHANEVLLGTQALLFASGASRAIVAIESDMPQATNAMAQAIVAANDERITLSVVRTIYPAGGERQLIHTLTEREVPSGGVPADVDVLCHNVGTAWAIARLIRTGLPLIRRVVTVTGAGVREPRNLRALIGTPISDLIADCGGYGTDADRLIMGGTMMGVALGEDSVAVTAATNCVVAASREEVTARPPELPCIRCGDCADVCPANLLPQQLHRYAKLQDRAALEELGLQDCIECGCCDYVCPSHIRLASNFIAAKLLRQS